MLPKSILVPTDLSPGAEEALDYACELATKLDATIHLVNVIGMRRRSACPSWVSRSRAR